MRTRNFQQTDGQKTLGAIRLSRLNLHMHRLCPRKLIIPCRNSLEEPLTPKNLTYRIYLD